jgi:hypothetical protein
MMNTCEQPTLLDLCRDDVAWPDRLAPGLRIVNRVAHYSASRSLVGVMNRCQTSQLTARRECAILTPVTNACQ